MAGSHRKCSPIQSDKDAFTRKIRSYVKGTFEEMWQKCRPSGEAEQCLGEKVVYHKKAPEIEPHCKCDTCQSFLEKILRVHANGPYPILIPWSNCDVTKWGTDPWQIAKLFLTIESCVPAKLETADIDSLITIIDRCKMFDVSMDNSQKMKDVSETLKRIEYADVTDDMKKNVTKLVDELAKDIFPKDITPTRKDEQVPMHESEKRARPTSPNGAGHHTGKRICGSTSQQPAGPSIPVSL